LAVAAGPVVESGVRRRGRSTKKDRPMSRARASEQPSSPSPPGDNVIHFFNVDAVDVRPTVGAAEEFLERETRYRRFLAGPGRESLFVHSLLTQAFSAAMKLQEAVKAAGLMTPGPVCGTVPGKADGVSALCQGVHRLIEAIESGPFASRSWVMGVVQTGLCVPAEKTFHFDPTAVAEIGLAVELLRKAEAPPPSAATAAANAIPGSRDASSRPGPLRGARDMSDPLQAHQAEIRAAEDELYDRCGREGRVIGSSVWSANLDRLREIDARHGIRPDDPRVYSIAAYQAERRQIDQAWDALCEERKWDRPDLDEIGSRDKLSARWRHEARLADCLERHFPGLNGLDARTIDSLPKSWAYISEYLSVIFEQNTRMFPAPAGTRPPTCEENVRQVYTLLHELKVPWAPPPPYPAFTQQEVRDELKRIANRLERDDAERCGRTVPLLLHSGATSNAEAAADQGAAAGGPKARPDAGRRSVPSDAGAVGAPARMDFIPAHLGPLDDILNDPRASAGRWPRPAPTCSAAPWATWRKGPRRERWCCGNSASRRSPNPSGWARPAPYWNWAGSCASRSSSMNGCRLSKIVWTAGAGHERPRPIATLGTAPGRRGVPLPCMRRPRRKRGRQ
jgi:hypothetical protein